MELIDAALPGFPAAPLRGALATDTGRHREHNEDAVGSYRPGAPSSEAPVDAALLVADGVGGHEGGQWASRFVVEAVHDTIAAQPARIDAPRGWLDQLLRSIHQELLTQARKRGTPTGMGSTATLAVVQGRTLTLAHVGDSRAYRLRNGHLEQLTHDHSWVAEQVRAGLLDPDAPEAAAKKNVLTQCLGIGRSLEVQVLDEGLSPGDRFLLCSDGLHGVVPDDALQRVLAGVAEPESAARQLVQLANDGGGPDNISAVVFDIGHPVPVGNSADSGAAAEPDPRGSEGSRAGATAGAAPPASRRAAPWLTGVGAVLLMIGGGAWMTGQVSARAAAAPTLLLDTAPAPPASAPDGEPTRVPVTTPAPPDTTSDPAPDTVAVGAAEVESPDTTGPAPDGARPDTLVPPDTLPHPRSE